MLPLALLSIGESGSPSPSEYLRSLREVEGVQQVVRGSVSTTQRRQLPAGFDELQDRSGFIGRVIDEAAFGIGRNNDSRNANPWTPAIAPRWRHVIPAPAGFVVRDDDHAVLPNGTVLHRLDQICHVLLTSQQVRITHVFVVSTDWLDEGHGRQVACPQRSKELLNVLQVLSSGGRPFRVRGEVVERLMMKLKERIGVARNGVIPTA